MTPEDLDPQLARVGVDLYEALRQLSNLNAPYEPPILPGEPVAMELDLPLFDTILRSLPDAAGTTAFVEAVINDWNQHMKPPPGGAGA